MVLQLKRMDVRESCKHRGEKKYCKTALKSSFLLGRLTHALLVLVSLLIAYNVAINVWRYDHVIAYAF